MTGEVVVRWSCGHRDRVDAVLSEVLLAQMDLSLDQWGRPQTGRVDWQGMPLPRFECAQHHGIDEDFEIESPLKEIVVPMSVSFPMERP